MKTPFPRLLFATLLTVAMIVAINYGQAQSKEQLQTQLEDCKKIADGNRNKAEAARLRAEKAEAVAKVQEQKAIVAQKEAEVNAELVRAAERGALKLRFLAQGKIMALKSKELGSDPIQEALVARQAYKFHSKYGGNPTDNEIYNGLYEALKRLNDPVTTKTERLDLSTMAESICKYVNRNLTRAEWDNFAGSDLPYDRTCENFPANDK